MEIINKEDIKYCIKITNLEDNSEEIVQNIWTDNPLVTNIDDNIILLDIFRNIKSMYKAPLEFYLKKNELIISMKETILSRGYIYNSTITKSKDILSLKFIPISCRFNILVEMDSVVTQTQPLETYNMETQTMDIKTQDKDTDIENLMKNVYIQTDENKKSKETEIKKIDLMPVNKNIKRFNVTDAIDMSPFEDPFSSFKNEFVSELKNKINEKVNLRKKMD